MRTHTHTLFPLYLTEPNYRHLSLSDETKKNCSIFRLIESEVSLSFLFFFSPSQRLLSSLRDASPAAHPLIWRLILDLLNKTQIKTDNEESFPLTATFICFDCYSESWMAVYVRSVKMAASAILSLRPASLVVKQNRRAHPWPWCVHVCVCVCWVFGIKWYLCSSAEFVLWEVSSTYPSPDSLFVPLP